MTWNRLSVKLMSAVGAASLLILGIFARVAVDSLRRQHLDDMIRSASQFSDMLKRSTHHAMLQNRWEDAFYTMETVGQQEGVVRVRVFSKDGLILFSTDSKEVGSTVNKQAESCYACHAGEKPLEGLKISQRARIITGDTGSRLLGMITPINNEPSCSEADCHAHPENKKVLGVLDIGLSLAQADANVTAMGRRMAILGGLMLLLVLSALFITLQRSVIRPVRGLLEGTERIARGDLDHVIEVATGDEIGSLAVSFNDMTDALRHTRADLATLVETLEERVEQRTKALREAQSQLIQSEKLASLGRLSASIAHEINNPLAGILTYAKLLIRKLKDSPAPDDRRDSMLKSLSLVERETDRCVSIVRNLLDFSRQREPRLEDVDLNTVVEEALSLVANRMAIDGLTLETQLDPLPTVWADFSQLRQAFLNIVLNACQAMKKGGVLTVRTRSIPERGLAEVKITDTGVGIPAENLSSLFDPFFTTKEKGTGLGLSVVYGILERHKGTIDIESQVGKGTSVTVRLPVATEQEEAPAIS